MTREQLEHVVLLREQMIELGKLERRIAELDSTRYSVGGVIAWARRRATEATAS